jgi:4'-phosphopantetheinyl transferase
VIALRLDSVARCAAAWQRDRAHLRHERDAALAIGTPLRRAQFQAGRWLAAQLLARHAGGDARAWRVGADAFGAPHALSPLGSPAPFLSIAHRGDAVVAAVADAPVGVDVEVARPTRSSADERAPWVLCAAERPAYDALAAADRPAALLMRWTLKEAWSKRDGRGLWPGAMAGLAAHPAADDGHALVWVDGALTVALACDALAGNAAVDVQGLSGQPQRWRVARATAAA